MSLSLLYFIFVSKCLKQAIKCSIVSTWRMIQWSQSTLYYFAWTLRSSWIRWRFVGLLWTFSFIQINGSCCAWRRRQDRKSRRSSHHLIWCFWWMQGRVWTCLCLSLRVSRVYNFCEGLGGTMSHPPVYRILIWWATYCHWEHAEQLHHHLVWRLHCIRLRACSALWGGKKTLCECLFPPLYTFTSRGT